jgi:hypothetical protein
LALWQRYTLVAVLAVGGAGCTGVIEPSRADGAVAGDGGARVDGGAIVDGNGEDSAAAGPCRDVSCGAHGTCVANAGAAACQCEAGFHAEGLTCVADPPVDPCAAVVCGANAACAAGACVCNTGFQGDPTVACSPTPSQTESDVRAELVRIARAEIGNCEGVTPRPYMLGQPGLWCYDFVAWVYAQASYSLPTPMSLPEYHVGALPPGWRPEPGDLIKFTIQHYGMVESVSADGTSVSTIEGNYGSCVVASGSSLASIDYFGSLDTAF